MAERHFSRLCTGSCIFDRLEFLHANGVDPNRSTASDLGLHCLPRSQNWDARHERVNVHVPPHDKTNKMSVRPAKTQISLGMRPVSVVYIVHLAQWSRPLLAE